MLLFTDWFVDFRGRQLPRIVARSSALVKRLGPVRCLLKDTSRCLVILTENTLLRLCILHIAGECRRMPIFGLVDTLQVEGRLCR